ncbi:MAG: TonB-dependent receptor [Oligoflexales bacterium]
MKVLDLFLCSFLSIFFAFPVFANPENKIWVYGKRKERFRRPHAGKSLKLKPSESSRLFSDTHLKEDASLKPEETGRSSPSGFSLPKIRGQDQKLTEVWVEDALIHDPWEGLPLASELDLVAFGELSLVQGVSPADLMSLNPIGSLKYSVRKLGRSRSKLGFSVGEPYGSNFFARTFQHWNLGSMHGSSLLYGRSYQTDGRYHYYQDQGNPYDTESGSYQYRSNNDQKSLQLMPYTSLRIGKHYLNFIGLMSQSKSGIPGYGSFLSLAKQIKKGGFASAKYTYEFGNHSSFLIPTSFKLGTYYRDEVGHTSDPEHPLLDIEVNESRRMKVKRLDAGLLWQSVALHFDSKLQLGESQLETNQNQNTILAGQRKHIQGLFSSILNPLKNLSIEIKILDRMQVDQFSSKVETYQSSIGTPSLEVSHRMQAYSLASSLQGPSLLAYIQVAFYQRPPTMIEEFGDGNRVVPSLFVKPETMVHHEIGLDYELFAKKLTLHIGAFLDCTSEKIAFVPALAYTYIAKNIENTLVRGGELAAEINWGHTNLLASYTYLQPQILSRHFSGRVIPGLSRNSLILSASQYLNQFWNLRLRARYRSEAYRDMENSILVPNITTYDASSDYKIGFVKKYELSLGLSIINLTDIKTMPLTSPYDSNRKGLIAYSDVDGYPLPGRQCLLHVHLDF